MLLGIFGGIFGRIFGAIFGGVGEVEPLPAFEEYSATLVLDPSGGPMANSDIKYVIKEGDRLPGIAGRITVPYNVDLEDADLYMTYRGRTTAARTVAVVNDGLADGSPVVGNEAEEDTIWRWHHDWAAGETSPPDRYQLGISAELGGRQLTTPSDGWTVFVIQAQLAEDPVP